MDQYSYNRLSAKVLVLEEETKRLRRVVTNCFKLICSIGVTTGCVPEAIVKKAMDGLDECNG